jgi:hypothetical protein
MADIWMLKFKFHLIETTHRPLHLDKRILEQWRIMNIPTSFIWIIIFFDGGFKYGDVSKFWGYVGINADLLCVGLGSSVECKLFIFLYLSLIQLFSIGMTMHNSSAPVSFHYFYKRCLEY